MGISRSGYYHWKRRKSERAAREREYAEKVRNTFVLGEGTYGASRICGKLRQDGFPCSFYKVREYMDIQGLRCIHIRRRQRSLTDSRKARGDGYFNLTRNLGISGHRLRSCQAISVTSGREKDLIICARSKT